MTPWRAYPIVIATVLWSTWLFDVMTHARMPYDTAWLAWSAILAAMYVGACLLLWRHAGQLRAYPVEAAACAVAMPAFYSTLLHGQLSALALLLVTLAFVAWRHRAPLVAGICIGCLAFRPQWVVAALAVWLAAREWRVAAGVVVAAVAQLLAMIALNGTGFVAAYVRMLRAIPAIGELLEPRPSLSLRGLAGAIVIANGAAVALYACAGLLVVVMAARTWRAADRDEIRFPVVLLAIVLVSPHVLEYDLLLLAPAFVLLASWILDAPDDPSRRLVMWSLCALFFAPVLLPIPAVARVSIAVGAMLTILATCGFAVMERSEEARERRRTIASEHSTPQRVFSSK